MRAGVKNIALSTSRIYVAAFPLVGLSRLQKAKKLYSDVNYNFSAMTKLGNAPVPNIIWFTQLGGRA